MPVSIGPTLSRNNQQPVFLTQGNGVIYIKIARKDNNGNDNTLSLQELNNIRVKFSDRGIVDYPVVNITEYPDYYLYQISRVNATSSADDHFILFSRINGGSGVAVSSDATLKYVPSTDNLSATSFNRVTVTAPASAATLTLANNSTLATVSYAVIAVIIKILECYYNDHAFIARLDRERTRGSSNPLPVPHPLRQRPPHAVLYAIVYV
jgi:hypothetical protein